MKKATKAKMDSVVHFEMPYEDKERLIKFYSQAFGWQMTKMGEEMGGYVTAATTETDANRMIRKPGAINGGFYPKDDNAPCPSVVVAVDDIREGMKRVVAAGGKVLADPVEIPGIGLYVSFLDSEGNRLSLLQPKSMPA